MSNINSARKIKSMFMLMMFLVSTVSMMAQRSENAMANASGATTDHPEKEVYKSPTGGIELIDQREEFSKTFQNEDGSFTKKASDMPMHYKGVDGLWYTYDRTLKKNGQGIYSIPQTKFPISLNANTGEVLMTLNSKGEVIRFGKKTSTSYFNASNQQVYHNTTGSFQNDELNKDQNAVYFKNHWNGIDRKQRFDLFEIETDYIIAQKPTNISGGGKVLFTEQFILPAGAKVIRGEGVEGQYGFSGELIVQNAKGENILNFRTPIYYDQNTYVNEITEGIPADQVPQVDPQSRPRAERGFYVYQMNGNELALSVVVSTDWLMAPERSYPVIIDPTVSNSDFSFRPFNSYGYSAACSYSLPVFVPAGTVTGWYAQFQCYANGCTYMNETGSQVGYNANYQGQFNGVGWGSGNYNVNTPTYGDANGNWPGGNMNFWWRGYRWYVCSSGCNTFDARRNYIYFYVNYNVNTPCTGTPNGGSASISNTGSCIGSSVTLTGTSQTTGLGITYQWQSSPDNFTWSDIAGATTTTFNVTPGAGMTYYRLRTFCINSGGQAFTNTVSFNGYVCVPSFGSSSVTTCSGNIYDHAGPFGNYSNSIAGWTAINPSTAGAMVQVSGSVSGESCCDYLYIYNGVGTGGTLLWSGVASTGTVPTITSTSGPLTVYFTSDGSVTGTGFNLTINCITPPPSPTSISASPGGAVCGGTPVTLTANGASGTVHWFTGGCNSSGNFTTGSTITVSPTVTTTYFARNFSSGIYSPSCASYTVTVNPTPMVNAGPDQTICDGGTTTLAGSANVVTSVTPTSLGLGNSYWYNNSGGCMFDVTSNGPSVNITGFDIRCSNNGPQTVNVYYKSGTYNGFQGSPGSWTLLGTYSVNGNSSSLVYMPVSSLNVPSGQTVGIYLNYNAQTNGFGNFYNNADITYSAGIGLFGFFSSWGGGYFFNGRIYYDRLNTSTAPVVWSPPTGLSSTTILNPTATPPSTITYTLSSTVNGCTGSDQVVVNVQPDPVAPTATKVPNVSDVCVGAQLFLTSINPGSGGIGSCNVEYSFSTNGGITWSSWSTSSPTITATGTDNRIKIRRQCTGTGCSSAETEYQWNVVPDPTTPTATPSPATGNVCYGATLTLTNVVPGTGGAGTCNVEYRFSTNNGWSWSSWSQTVPVMSAFNTYWTYFIEVRQVCSGTDCISGVTSYSWYVIPDPDVPSANKLPNTSTVCEGAALTLTNVWAGSGGTGTCNVEYSFTLDGGATWSAWTTTMPTITATGSSNGIRMRRSCTGADCFSGINQYFWNVTPDPSAPSATQSPSVTTVCVGANLTLTNINSGFGGTGSCFVEYAFSYDGGATWSSWSGSIPNLTATGTDNKIKMRRVCTGSDCFSTETIYTWTVVPDPNAPTATKLPNVPTVCIGSSLTLTGAITTGGGAGTCTIEYATSTNGGATWSSWSTTVPTITATGTDNRIKIRTTCTGSGCLSNETVYTWGVVPDPAMPQATKLPDLAQVCAGQILTVINPIDNGGGTGNCNIEYAYSTDNGLTYTAWSTTVPSFAAVAGGNNIIKMRKVCDGSGCDISGERLYLWNVVQDPQAPTATKSPNQPEVCEGVTLTVINPVDNGGGTGTCSIQYCYSTDNGVTFTAWSTTVPSFTSVQGGNNIIKMRKVCNGSGCDISTETSYTWLVYDILPPMVTISASDVTICQGDQIDFTATPFYGGPNPTYEWYVNGLPQGQNSTTFSSTTLNNLDVITATMVSDFDCAFTPYASSNIIVVQVGAIPVTPSVTVTASQTSICDGDNVVFTATGTGGGPTPSYQWYVNGNPVGNNNPVFTSVDINDGDQVTVELTSSEPCVTIGSVSSNIINMTVSPNGAPTMLITTATANICIGDNVTFTATVTNEGTSPIYEWYINGVSQGNNSLSFTYNNFQDGDVVTAAVTSNNPCAVPPSAFSNPILMNVGSLPLTPSVTIDASATDICSGNLVVFTASPTNSGPAPVYQWSINGNPLGPNSPVFSTSNINDGDQVSVEMTTTAACATTNNVTSNTINMVVNPTLIPGGAIAASSNNICSGDNVTITLTPLNEGSSPSYEWFINGIAQNINSTTFSTSTLNNGDVINAVVYSSEVCATPHAASSNNLVITVSPLVTPSVNITANADSICSGSQVLFSANAVNLGNSGSYQWFVNGLPVGQNSAIFTSSTLNDGDEVNVEITSSLTCVATTTAASLPIEMTVVPAVQASIMITASDVNICGGDTISFASTLMNEGTSPVFEWYINGLPQSNDSSEFVFANFSNGDIVTATLTTSAACAASATVSSNNIVMTVGSAPVTPAVNISASQNSICSGTNVIFTANTQYPGNNPTYQWLVNGTPVGGNSPTFTSNGMNDGDEITLTLTSNELCVTAATVYSDTIQMAVEQISYPSISISASDNNICSGSLVEFTASIQDAGVPTIEWFVNGVGQSVNDTLFTSNTLNNGDVISAIVSSSLACANQGTVGSNNVVMTVIPSLIPSVSATASDTAVCFGSNVVFTASAINAGTNPNYQWYINGLPAGSNSSVYSSTSLSSGDTVTVMLNSSEVCSSADTVMSNGIIMTVYPVTTANATIAASTNTICGGDTVMFTSSVINAGQTPSFDWFVNGISQATNNDTIFISTLSNGAVVNMVVTSSDVCANPVNTSSNNIVINVNPVVIPQVSIAASDSVICIGSNVLFSSNSAFAGSQPFYQWTIDGTPVGANTNLFSTTTLYDSAQVQLFMVSSQACSTPDTAFSNIIQMAVKQLSIPSAFISTPQLSICEGDTAVFEAQIGGVAESSVYYTWLLNGQIVLQNDSIYQYVAANSGDVISLIASTNVECAIPASVSSNEVTITINPSDSMDVSIISTTGLLCEGTEVTFVSTVNNGGPTPKYMWMVNGNIVGANNPVYVSPGLDSGDVVTLSVYTNNQCSLNDSAASNAMVITPTPSINAGVDVTIFTGDSIQLEAIGTIPGVYSWTPAGLLNDANIYNPYASPNSTTEFTVTLTTADGCRAEDELVIIVKEGAGLYSSFTPNGDGINDVWIIENLEEYPTCTVEIFNRWGNQVFSSVGYAVPWDGTYKGEALPFGVYYYIIQLHDDAEPLQGTVTILK